MVIDDMGNKAMMLQTSIQRREKESEVTESKREVQRRKDKEKRKLENKIKSCGQRGLRSLYLTHAKRALYQLS